MSDIELPESDAESRLELRALFSYVWQGRTIILLTIGIFVLLGLLWYRTAPRIYEASTLLSAAPGSMTNSQIGGGALSGAARLIGLGGGGSSGSEYTKFQALLTSSALAERLATSGLLQRMYPNQWDEASHSWKQSRGVMVTIKSGIRAVLGLPPQHAPDAENVFGMLHSEMIQDLSLQTSLLKLSVTSDDPELARTILIMVHRQADNILRDAARIRSQRRIDYIQNTLAKVNAVEQRDALIQLLNQEEQTNMMIESDPNYAADIVDPPHVAPTPVSPLFTATLFISVVLGFMFGFILYVLLRTFNLHDAALQWRPYRRSEA